MKNKILGLSVCMLLIATAIPALGTIENDNPTMRETYDDYKNLIKHVIESGVISLNDCLEEDKLLASDGAADDHFGCSVSIDGDYAIIGSPYDDDNGVDSGSAYVFNRTGSVWTQQAKLLASDGAAEDYFGEIVTIDGDSTIIGAYGNDDNGVDSGSAYVFIRDGTSWTQQAKLLASDGAADDHFGCSVSIDGDYAIIGSPYDDDNGSDSGSAYVFIRDGTSWTQQAKLLASDGAAGDYFGETVSIHADSTIIGSPYDDDNGDSSGSAYVFTRTGSIWTEEAKLLASDGAASDWFGCSVSIDGDSAIIGSPYDDDNGGWSGSAYVFNRTGAVWTEQAKLLASDGAAEDYFGEIVTIDGDSAIIGAYGNDDNGEESGSAYVFIHDGTSWTQQARLLASDGAADDHFGCSVSIDGDSAIVGSPYDDDNGSDSGSAYVFKNYIENEPPNPPTNPVPANGSLDVDIDADLSWNCSDPNGDDLTYDVYFEANDLTPDEMVSENQSSTTYDPGTLNLNTTYYWKIVAWDIVGASTEGPIWNFTTMENEAPNTPSDPEPEDGATDVDINADLSWDCSDPDGDDLTYDVYFEANDPTPDVLVSNNQSETTYDPGEMEYGTHYFWKIVAWDPYQYTEGFVWDFTTGSYPNNPPYIPSDPDPENESTNVDIDSNLLWVGGDPDDDPVVYDVYFEANDQTPDDKVADDITETTFDPGTMEYDTIYFWRIIAKDSHGASTWGPVWHFTTPTPDLYCEGSLSWGGIKPGKTVNGDFTVSNSGDSLSLLDWEITEYPSWGNIWEFNPMSGDDLKPSDGPITVSVKLTAPDEKNSEFDGEVKIVNKENSSDFCTIDVSLTTPKNKAFNFYMNILMWLFERFPNAFPILRYMLGL